MAKSFREEVRAANEQFKQDMQKTRGEAARKKAENRAGYDADKGDRKANYAQQQQELAAEREQTKERRASEKAQFAEDRNRINADFRESMAGAKADFAEAGQSAREAGKELKGLASEMHPMNFFSIRNLWALLFAPLVLTFVPIFVLALVGWDDPPSFVIGTFYFLALAFVALVILFMPPNKPLFQRGK